MDRELFQDVDRACPNMNPVIAKGLAVREINRVEEEIESTFRKIAKQYPSRLNLEFNGGVRCTPEETRQQGLRPRRSINTFELSYSSLYLMKYYFSMNGVPLHPIYLYLPYTHQAGIVAINGSRFAVSPVLADIAMSIGADNIFIHMGKSKITFKRTYHGYIRDGDRADGAIVWCKAHNSAARVTDHSKKTSNYHYIFCKYGLTETFSRFAQTKVVVGTNEINTDNFPETDWSICTSIRLKPKGKTGNYRPSDIRIAIPRGNVNEVTSDMINAFFYMVDHFPEVISPDNVDDPGCWRAMLGHCIFRDGEHVRKVLPKMNDHMRSIDNSLDSSVKEWLRADEIYVNDAYELFAHIAQNFTPYVSGSAKKLSSMYGKRLIVLRYVLDNIVGSINNTLFDLEKIARKANITIEEVQRVFKTRLQPRLIQKINQKHAEVSSVSSACDCMIPKITSVMVLQSNMSGTQSSKSKSASFDESNSVDASIAEVAGFNNISKGAIDGRGKVNTFLKIRLDGTVEQDPRFIQLLKDANHILHGE